MLNALTGFGRKWTNPSAASISGLPAARKLQDEVGNHEKRGDLDKAKECFETGIRKAEDLFQSNLNEPELSKTRELLAASYFYYGNFLRQCGDKFNAASKYRKALEHAPHMNLEHPDVLDLYNQIGIQYGSFLIKNESVSEWNKKQLDLKKELVENARPSKLGPTPPQRQVGASIQEKSKRMDYLFGKALSTLGALKVANKPSLFLVYAHDNPAHGKAEASTSKYLIEKLSQIQVILYSDQTPMGQPYSSVSRDLNKDGKLEDILTNQLCLLPGRLRGDVAPVDKVTVCCSEVLGSYLKWLDYGHFYQKLREAYRKDREAYLKDSEQDSAVAIREVVREFSQEESYKAGFHHVLTEMAFLQIRAEELKDKHGIIPVALTWNSYDECLSDFVSATAVRMEDIPCFEEKAQAGREVYANQSRHGVLFKLIERLLAGSDEAQMFLNKFWQGCSDCISHLENDSKFDGLEFTQFVDSIFDDIRKALHNELAFTVQQLHQQLRNQQEKELRSKKGPLAILGESIEAEYFKGWEEPGEIQDGLAMYVAPQGKLTVDATEHFDLEGEVDEFLVSDKKVLLLLGEGGSGKSTFNRYLARRLWKDYTQAENPQEKPIPLFIPLSRLESSSKNLIEQYLEEQGLSKPQIEDLRKAGPFIFILDGYDEIAQRSRAFYADNKLERWQAKVIISSRPEYLGTNYQFKFYPVDKPNSLQECNFVAFSNELINSYIDKYVEYRKPEWKAKEYKKFFNEVNELKELVRTPFMLKMTLEVLPTLKAEGEQSKLTRIGLYERFVENWLNRSQERLGRIRLKPKEQEAFEELDEEFTRHGWNFSQNLALAMYEKQLVSVAYSEARDGKNRDWRSSYLGDAEEKTRLLRFNAPLSRQGEQYRFIHKSLRDYFVARELWKELSVDVELKSSAWFNKLNIVKDPAVLQFLAERVQQDAELENHLLRVVERSKGEEGTQFKMGAANALTLLVKAGVHLIGKDFSGVRVSGADLSYGVFERTQFEGADLSKVTLRGAWLCSVNMRRANLENIEFGEMPALELGGWVYDCSYSPDGRWLAVAINPGGRKLYRVKQNGTQQKIELKYSLGGTWLGRRIPAHSVAFSPDNQWLASADFDATIRLWSIETGELGHAFKHNSALIYKVSFSRNSQQLVSCSHDKTIKLWSVQEGKLQYTLEEHKARVSSVSISPDGKWLASGSEDKTMKLWELGDAGVSLHQTLTEHNDEVHSVEFSPDSEWLASGGRDMTVKLWKLGSTGGVELFQTLEGHGGIVTSLSFSSDRKWLASGSIDYTVKLWELGRSGVLLHQTFEGHSNQVLSVSFSPDNKWLVSGSVDKTMKLWSLENESILSRHKFEGHNGRVWSVSVSQDGKLLASGSVDKSVKIWGLESAGISLRQTLEGHNGVVLNVSISPDGKWLASGSSDKTVKLWKRLSPERIVLHQTLEGYSHKVWGLSISSDSKWLVSGGGDSTVKLWELSDTGASLSQRFERHSDEVRGISLSPDGKWLAFGSIDKTVKLWKLGDSGKAELHQTLGGHAHYVFSVSFSPDGKWLASGSFDCTVKLWELREGKEALLRQTLKGHRGEIFSVSFSPDGKWLVSGGADGTVKLWSLDTGTCKATIQCFIRIIHSVAWQEFTQNSTKIVVAGSENMIRIFQLARKENGWKSNLYWTSHQNELTLGDLMIESAQNLDPETKRLITQKLINVSVSASRPSEVSRLRLLEAVSGGMELFKNLWNLEGVPIQNAQSLNPAVGATLFPGAFPTRISNASSEL